MMSNKQKIFGDLETVSFNAKCYNKLNVIIDKHQILEDLEIVLFAAKSRYLEMMITSADILEELDSNEEKLDFIKSTVSHFRRTEKVIARTAKQIVKIKGQIEISREFPKHQDSFFGETKNQKKF